MTPILKKLPLLEQMHPWIRVIANLLIKAIHYLSFLTITFSLLMQWSKSILLFEARKSILL